jgi:hypothetical protein
MSTKKEKSFWQTLPGIITAVTGLVVAIELFGGKRSTPTVEDTGPTPTSFPTSTPVDAGVVLPTPVPVTAEPEPEPTSPPTCTDFEPFTGKANPNAILLAFTDSEFWVQYGGLDENIQKEAGITAQIYSGSEKGALCLRDWVKYLTVAHTPHWPTPSGAKGREYHEVWLSSLTPPLVGELSSWAGIPDNILITTVDETFSPDSAQIYICGADIPEETLSKVAYWHAATDEEALADYLDLYSSNGYTALVSVACQN